MKIAQVTTLPFQPYFSNGGFVAAGVHLKQLDGRLVRLETTDGASGIGEIVRPPRLSGIDWATLEEARLAQLAGLALDDLPALIGVWRSEGTACNGLAHGVETALLDLVGCRSDLPLSSLLGGRSTGSMPTYTSLTAGDVEMTLAQARKDVATRKVIQLKAGVAPLVQDLEVVRALLDAVPPDNTLIVDFNGALSQESALGALAQVRDPRLFWEDPCSTYEENLSVARSLEQPIIFDQCVKGVAGFVRVIRDAVAAGVVIKCDLLGGPAMGRVVRDLCAAAGLRMRVDGCWSGQVSAAAALHVALGVPPELLIATIDLTEALDTTRDLIDSTHPGAVGPVIGPGLGRMDRSTEAIRSWH